MTRNLLADALAHHVWATLRLMDTCAALDPDPLRSGVPGTFGSILDTLRHIVGADASYLFVIGGERYPRVDADDLDLPSLRAVMERHGPAWARVLETDLDPDTVLTRRREDGSEYRAPLGIRLAQVLHHGSDHRSQICTALTALGVQPPDIDVWDFGAAHGRTVEVPPPA